MQIEEKENKNIDFSFICDYWCLFFDNDKSNRQHANKENNYT